MNKSNLDTILMIVAIIMTIITYFVVVKKK